MRPLFLASAVLSLANSSLSHAAEADKITEHLTLFQSRFTALIDHGQEALRKSSEAADAGNLGVSCSFAKASHEDFSNAHRETSTMIAEIETAGFQASELKATLPDLQSMSDETAKAAQKVCGAAESVSPRHPGEGPRA
jgi:hypothetical protein